MANTIRGLTVEISADASKFNKQMSAVRKDSKTTQTELNALQKSLQLDFDDKKFAQAQKKVQEAIDVTAERADLLRQRLQFLEENDSVDTSHYRQIQSELAQCELEGQKLQKQLEQINQMKFDAVATQIKNVGNGLASAGKAVAPLSAAAAGAIAAFGGLGLKAATTGAQLDDLSLRFGVSAEKIQEWQYLAVQTGVDIEVFNKALIRARASMLDLATGTENNATKAMRNLGLNIKNFASNEDMFDGVISALAAMEDKTLQAAYANEIFGDKIANQMLPFLNAGKEELQKFKDEFASMSTLSNEQVKALAQLDDTIYLLKESFKNVALQIGASFAPLLKKLADTLQNTLIPKLQQLAEWFNSLSLSQQEFIAKALLLVAALSPILLIIGKLTSGIGNIISLIPKLSGALSTLAAHPIVLIIAAIAAILVILYTKCEAFRESINRLVSTLGEALKPILDIVMELLQTLMDLISPILDTLGQILAVVINIVIDALSPLFEMLSLIFELIKPLLQLALIPLQIAFTALEVPLKVLGQLLQWLSPLFKLFANIVKGAFDIVIKVINVVLGAVESAVNFVIDVINGLIDTYNFLFGWLFGKADNIGHINLKINTSTGSTDNLDNIGNMDDSPYNSYDGVENGGTTGDIYNNDYSTSNKTQNVTVVIENYAQDVDVDALVLEINKKLAEEV